ncbi:Inhibitor of nuclear factor kappa-B kinase subunit alpha [Oopsacas minuta]|uniref:IkappaB kinase n=1 Tax=Oopsacas minuta TaxID=111878 RepID=A0AAV7K361_9METZ|nr:Inhibitor of nuclear factor kappa-B kinase subunit alpha [Oopsacas minuta]
MSDIPLLPHNYPDTRHLSGPQGIHSSEHSMWVEKRHLGQGTFGRVSLWVRINDETQEMAIKFYDKNVDHSTLVRSLKEEQLLQQTNHPNIVRYLKQPPDFISPQAYTSCGIICMEYCNRGDLRKMIRQSENIFGASQNIVLLFLSNISSALQYLHTQNIIHRDIKPENILLKSESQNSVAFKLVDLGFATQYSNQSNFPSFVGTMQYFPPEMVVRMSGTTVDDSASPNSTVDLWAFGIVVFELICGTRPFVPSLAGFEWLQLVKKKEKEHICIYKDKEGEICYSTDLLLPNQLDEPYARAIAEWLTLLLDKDPMTRGGRDKARNITESIWPIRLQQILSTCYIKVAIAHELRSKYYDCVPGLKISTFIQRISRETGNPDNLIILCHDGRILDPEGVIDQCLTNKHTGELYILPNAYSGRPPPIDLATPLHVMTLLDQNFSAMDSAQFSFIVNPVFQFVYKRYQEVMTFLKAGASLQRYIEEHLKEMSDLEHNLRISTETIYSRCSFIQENILEYILKEMESFLRKAECPEQTAGIQASIRQWYELKTVINSILPEVHSIDTDHCKSAAETIIQAKNLMTEHPCQAYIKELQMRFLHLQSVVRLLMDMSDRSYYANGTRLASDINDFIDFINARFIEMQAYFLECITLYNTINEHRYVFNRNIGLIEKDFLCHLNDKFVRAFTLAFQSVYRRGAKLNSFESPHNSIDTEQEVSLSDTMSSLEETCNQCEKFFNEIHSIRLELADPKDQTMKMNNPYP